MCSDMASVKLLVGNFNTPLSLMNRSLRQKLSTAIPLKTAIVMKPAELLDTVPGKLSGLLQSLSF